MRLFIFGTLVLLFLQPANAQIKKFGKVTKDEFSIKDDEKYAEDDAVILFRKYDTKYEYNQSTGWKIIMKTHERILLKNKDGFDYATQEISLYTANNRDEKVRIKAATYNLEDGKVVKTKLKKSAIYKQQKSKHWNEKVFTMPNLKEGSIVEWTYSIESPYVRNINSLIYKTLIPVKYLEAKVSIPEFFHFKYSTTPFFPINLKEETRRMSVQITEKTRYNQNSIIQKRDTKFEYHNYDIKLNVYTLNLKDIEPISIEPFMNSINNYIGKVSFELSFIKYPNDLPEYISTTWEDVCKTIYDKSSFGNQLKKTKYFEDDLAEIIKTGDTPQAKMHKILAFVKEKVRWNNDYQIVSEDGVKKAYKNGSGNVAEINFILIAMLRASGLEAYPVLASTNTHGTPMFPTLEGFNYVLTAVRVNDTYTLIDPTEKNAPAGVLPRRILNWKGRLIKKDGTSEDIQLFPEHYALSVKIITTRLQEDLGIKGYSNEKYNGNLALRRRNKYSKASKEDIIKDYEDRYDNISIENIRVSAMDQIDKPLNLMVQFNIEDEVEEVGDKLVFSPVLFLKDNENVFKSEERNFPIYFGFPFKISYKINISIPDTYTIEKLPENMTLSLPENMGNYSYQIQNTGNKITLIVVSDISTSIYPNTLYKELKDFFEKIFTKEHEKVILSKK